VVICLANSQGIDLDDAFAQTMAKVTSRDGGRWTRKAR
jgi:NTP pyrophosphatase (non-canonical NTP hydrolase)